MTVQYDYMLVVDVEATCWAGQPPPGEMSEIIEIGVCLLDIASLERSAPHSLLIKPTRSKISPFCTSLTTITPEQVADGMSFKAACTVLQAEYLSPLRWWGSWGAYDLKLFRQQCASFGVEYPFSECHLNIKQTFAKLKGTKPMGMAAALHSMGYELEGTHHRGGDDARNIARLLGHVLETGGREVLTEGC